MQWTLGLTKDGRKLKDLSDHGDVASGKVPLNRDHNGKASQ